MGQRYARLALQNLISSENSAYEKFLYIKGIEKLNLLFEKSTMTY